MCINIIILQEFDALGWSPTCTPTSQIIGQAPNTHAANTCNTASLLTSSHVHLIMDQTLCVTPTHMIYLNHKERQIQKREKIMTSKLAFNSKPWHQKVSKWCFHHQLSNRHNFSSPNSLTHFLNARHIYIFYFCCGC